MSDVDAAGWRAALVNDDPKKPVYAVGPGLSTSRLAVPFSLDATSEVFVAFMQSFKAKAPYGVAAISADNAAPPTLFDGGALQDRLHLLITRRIAVAEPGPHELELVMTNETQTAGHAFAFYGVFAQAATHKLSLGRRRP